MSSRNALIADAVTAALNAAPAGTFNLDFGDARRVWQILLTADWLGSDPVVHVSPKTCTQEPRAKGGVTYRTFQVDVAARQRVGVGDGGEFDNDMVNAVAELLERLADFFKVGAPLSDTGASLKGAELSDPLIDQNQLYTLGVALGVVTLTFEMV